MSEPLSEFMAIRCTASMKQSLESIAEKGINRNVADHIRFAVEMYIDGGLNAIDTDEMERARQELEKAFGQAITKGQLITKLIHHWDITKRDSYGFQRFS